MLKNYSTLTTYVNIIVLISQVHKTLRTRKVK